MRQDAAWARRRAARAWPGARAPPRPMQAERARGRSRPLLGAPGPRRRSQRPRRSSSLTKA
eukprot:1994954-Alexandrium_andersonii.AAC.1